jgi:hypothetical protein
MSNYVHWVCIVPNTVVAKGHKLLLIDKSTAIMPNRSLKIKLSLKIKFVYQILFCYY